MKKFITIAAISALALGATAQTTTYKMRVVKTDGTEIFYKTADVDHVDFVEDNQEEEKLKIFLAGDNENSDGPCKVNRMEKIGRAHV